MLLTPVRYFLTFCFCLQAHVYGHERRTKDQQQNRHVHHVGSVQRRFEDSRGVPEPSPVEMRSDGRAPTYVYTTVL